MTAASVLGMPVSPERAQKIATASANIEHWTAERDREIHQAHAEGGGVREIARIASLSHTGVIKILKRGSS